MKGATIEGLERAAATRAAGAAALPRLNSNNCNEPPLSARELDQFRTLSTNHRKTAFKLSKSVERLVTSYGIERVGFLTLTFADHVTCAKEAGRRFHSLQTGVIGRRYRESICVLERMKSGRIHFHLLVVLAVDIRSGFSFEQAAAGVYTSASSVLRAEWAFWRKTAREYGFGRTELLPVKSCAEGLSKYVGKYIAKHVGQREHRDKGVRLVRYSRGASIGSNQFMFNSPRSRLWRAQVKLWAEKHGCADEDGIRAKFGSAWAYHHRAEIMAIEPPATVVFEKDGEWVTLVDLWMADRQIFSQRVAADGSCTQAEAFMVFCCSHVRTELAFDVPRWAGVSTPRSADFSDAGPNVVTTLWKGADGGMVVDPKLDHGADERRG